MARGWESKSVESQMESARQAKAGRQHELSNEDKQLEREKQNLLLSRSYLQHQMESSSNSQYQESLRKAIEEISQKLNELGNHT